MFLLIFKWSGLVRSRKTVSISSLDGLSRRMTVPSILLTILNDKQTGLIPANVSKGTLALCLATSSLLLIMASLTAERWVVLII